MRHSRYFLVFRLYAMSFQAPHPLFFLFLSFSELTDGVIILRYLQTFSGSLFTISTNKGTKYFILPLPSQSRSEVSWIGFLTLDKFAHPSTTRENVLFSLLWLDAHLTSFSRISLARNSRMFAKHELLYVTFFFFCTSFCASVIRLETVVFAFRIFKLLGVWCWCYKILYSSCRLYFLCSLSKKREVVSETGGKTKLFYFINLLVTMRYLLLFIFFYSGGSQNNKNLKKRRFNNAKLF